MEAKALLCPAAGSSLTLFHSNAPEGTLERVRARSMLRRLDLRHVAGNPLDAEEMTSRLDVTQCALGP